MELSKILVYPGVKLVKQDLTSVKSGQKGKPLWLLLIRLFAVYLFFAYFFLERFSLVPMVKASAKPEYLCIVC